MEKLSHSQEDYLEEIYNQVLKFGFAKVTDISNSLRVRKASVTGALNALAAKKLINYEPYSKITLTEQGELFAREIQKKHESFCDFCVNVLNLSKTEASENACKMEHVVSEKFFKNFSQFSDFLSEYMKKNPDFIKEYKKIVK